MTNKAKWTGYFKVVQPKPTTTRMVDSQEMADVGAYNNFTWYQRLVQGSASRMTRYREYDLMDNDVEVSRAIDTIAEEMVGNNPKTKEPLIIEVLTEEENNVESATVLTAKAALRRWCKLHSFQNRLFSIARMTIKYGDAFFYKNETVFDKWVFIHPKNVIAAIVDAKDATKVIAWQLKKDIKQPQTGGYGMSMGASQGSETEIVDARKIVRFSLNDDMSDTQPFGESVLRPVYRSHKQKELLEDAVIIYRVQRAPERRVFYIDVGKMPPQRVKQYLETIKNEIKQKRVPTNNGGQSEIDSVYNPQSMNEDFFFACISMTTKIFLLDGRTLTLTELMNEFEQGKENWTYSVDQKTGKMIPGKIAWAGYTRRNAELVRVHLDNGESIDCTPDHKFVLRDGSEVQAQHLEPDTSLMSIYKKYQKTNKKQSQELYERIVDNRTGKWEFTHTQVCPKTQNETVVHHLDYSPSNNNPTNLVELTQEDHWKYHHSPNGHTLGRLWREHREDMIASIRKYHELRTDEQTARLIERNKKNGANTWIKHEQRVRQALNNGRQFYRESFDTYGDYCEHMSKLAVSQWTEGKRKHHSNETIKFNQETKGYVVDDKLFKLFVNEYNNGNNSMLKIKRALRTSDMFVSHFKNINATNQNVKHNKPLHFSDRYVYKIVNYGGYESFQHFKENYAPNHKVVRVEPLQHREDTGCLYVIDENNNHNFAVSSGVYIKNSRPDGRGSRVETLPGGQGLGELADLEYFQRKVWRGLKVPTSYMIEQQEGGQIWNDGKVGIAYIQELRFSLYIERLQRYLETTIDKEFKVFLKQCNIHIDESMYRVCLPEPSNFGKYRQLELDSQLLGTYGSAEGIPYLSDRFKMKRFLQLTDEEIITNERMKREELGLDPDSADQNLSDVYSGDQTGMGGVGGYGGLGGVGGVGGGFAGAELGMGTEIPPEGGAAGGTLPAGGGEVGGAKAPPAP